MSDSSSNPFSARNAIQLLADHDMPICFQDAGNILTGYSTNIILFISICFLLYKLMVEQFVIFS